jgi:type IV fimbrial biogenesis protein FimT|tara:strand:- start:183 stop:686 length:504 start_codon:yes stop_codon:yes gene_type:complete
MRGVTLIELLVTLGVAAVLLGLAAPAFNQFVIQRQLTVAINDLVIAINYARSEAAHIGSTVSVQAADAEDDNEWGGGYCVVTGTPGNCTEPVLRRFAPIDTGTLNGIDGPNGNLDGVDTLSFDARGLLTSGDGGVVRLCAVDGTNPGRILRVNLIGRTTTNDLECGE